MDHLEENFVFIYISTTEDKYSYLMTKYYNRFKLDSSRLQRPLVTGFYTLITYNLVGNTVILSSSEDTEYLGTIAANSSYYLNDLVGGVDFEGNSKVRVDAYNRFDFCGMLVEKHTPYRSGVNKRLYKMLTLNNVVVTMEVWYNEDNVNIPKIGDCLIIRDCYFDSYLKETFIKIKANQGFQWSYLNNQQWFKGVFKYNAKFIRMREIDSNSGYHYMIRTKFVPSYELFKLNFKFDKNLMKNPPICAKNMKDDTLRAITGCIVEVVKGSVVKVSACDSCSNVIERCVIEGEHTSQTTICERTSYLKVMIADEILDTKVEAVINNTAPFDSILRKKTKDLEMDLLNNTNYNNKYVFYCCYKKNELIILDVDLK